MNTLLAKKSAKELKELRALIERGELEEVVIDFDLAVRN